MKIGIYNIDVPASVGGGYVLRADLAEAARHYRGRHQFEIITVPLHVRAQSRIKRRIGKILGRPVATPTEELVKREVSARGIDMLWFNHFEPILIGVPYVLNIFDLQHRLQPYFPEVSAGGEWDHRERYWADAIRRSAIVTVGSPEAKEQLCHFYGVPHENAGVLPFPTPQKAINFATGVEQMPQKTDVRAKYGIKHDFLFYPAQFWPHKNHVNLLLALKALRDRGRPLSLVLTGSDHGNLAHVRNTVNSLGLEDLVHFCGFVPYEDVLTFYRDALALSYMSFFGPENLPPLEAMALGCPVVMSDIPGVRELHGEGPVLVNPRSPEAITNGILCLIEKPDETKTRIAAGRNMAIGNNCQLYLARLEMLLDQFEPIRRCWA